MEDYLYDLVRKRMLTVRKIDKLNNIKIKNSVHQKIPQVV